MEELIKMVSDKAGISEAQATQAVEVVTDYLKQKLPAPLASQVDSALAGESSLSDLGKGLGGMFGSK